jgi:muconolactone D-isomerase
MEFLVHIVIELPTDLDDGQRARLVEAESERARNLADEGLLRRLWRVPGQTANWGLWECPDATTLHEAIASLPLWPWAQVHVHPTAHHPNDPRSGHARET